MCALFVNVTVVKQTKISKASCFLLKAGTHDPYFQPLRRCPTYLPYLGPGLKCSDTVYCLLPSRSTACLSDISVYWCSVLYCRYLLRAIIGNISESNFAERLKTPRRALRSCDMQHLTTVRPSVTRQRAPAEETMRNALSTIYFSRSSICRD